MPMRIQSLAGMTHEFIPITAPVIRDEGFRISMTSSCRDSDHIPKVADAGKVVEGNGQRLQIMHNGIKVIAGGYGSDMMIRIIGELRGHHEPQEEAVFHEILKHLPAKASMIELGGFWSYYSLWFLKGFPANANLLSSSRIRNTSGLAG